MPYQRFFTRNRRSSNLLGLTFIHRLSPRPVACSADDAAIAVSAADEKVRLHLELAAWPAININSAAFSLDNYEAGASRIPALILASAQRPTMTE